MARVLDPEPGMEIYDPTCGSGGLLVKCESALEDRMRAAGNTQSPRSSSSGRNSRGRDLGHGQHEHDHP
jgi:23S rRNA G2445 N2-methylase RlmL